VVRGALPPHAGSRSYLLAVAAAPSLSSMAAALPPTGGCSPLPDDVLRFTASAPTASQARGLHGPYLANNRSLHPSRHPQPLPSAGFRGPFFPPTTSSCSQPPSPGCSLRCLALLSLPRRGFYCCLVVPCVIRLVADLLLFLIVLTPRIPRCLSIGSPVSQASRTVVCSWIWCLAKASSNFRRC
jgi:hypothetical protein